MEYNYTLCSFKDVIKSFEYWPRIFKLLWGVDKKNLVIITILYILTGFTPIISILITQQLINAIQSGVNKNFNYILVPFLLYIFVSFLSSTLSQLITYFEGIFELKLNYDLNIIVLNKAKDLNLSDFENSDIYDRLRRAQNEVGNRPYMVFTLILNCIKQIITLVSSAAILILWKWWIILFVLVVPVISSIYMIKIGHLQYKIQWNRAGKQRKSWYLTYLLTNDIAFKEIKLYSLGSYFIEGFKKLNKEFISQDKSIIVKRTKVSFIFGFIDEVVGGLICLLIIRAAFIGEILLGSTIAYIKCISNVQTNTQALLATIANMYQNNLYVKQIFEFIDLEISLEEEKSLIDINEIESIEFKNVYFKYANREDYALKNINFKIKKGENIALVGENGSGKTTLIKLISGFYENYQGEILINNINLRKINVKSLRKKIGIVFQDFTKYELTYRENVGVGNLKFMNEDDKIINASKKSEMDDFLKELPKGMETQLGVWFDEGIQISGGQWQKIALARAFLRDADCYILDEPSAALDPIAEYKIFKKSCDLTKDKIGIFITHRLFNIKRIASRILVLNDGQLIEEGKHDTLMMRDSHYKYLYRLQNSSGYNVSTEEVEEKYGAV